MTPARLAAYGMLVYAAVRFAGAYLDRYALAAAVAQAVIAEWGAGRIGIAWSDPALGAPTTKAIALRALRGAGMGLTAATVVLGVVLVTRGATLAPNTPSVVVVLVGALVPACLAARDELLLRGLVLHVIPAEMPAAAKLVACGLASAAATYGEGGAAIPGVLAAALGGVAFGALWLRDRGAWLAWGAHAAFMWASGPLAKGGLLDVRSAPTAWGGGDAGLGNAWATVFALALVCAGAVALARPRQSTSFASGDGSERPPSKTG